MVWMNPWDSSLMRVIPAGEFIMGSTTEQVETAIAMHHEGAQFPLRHEVPRVHIMTPAFSIGAYPVTNEQYARLLSERRPTPVQRSRYVTWFDRLILPACGNKPYRVESGFERHPVINVTWFGAQAYANGPGCGSRPRSNGRKPRVVPTAAFFRGVMTGTPNGFAGGQSWSRRNYESSGRIPEHGCSPYGIFQMTENVEEWCGDRYQPNVYPRYAKGDLTTPRIGVGRVIRGGNCMRKHRLEFRCAMRRSNPPAFANILLTGVRCAGSR